MIIDAVKSFLIFLNFLLPATDNTTHALVIIIIVASGCFYLSVYGIQVKCIL